MSPKPSSYYLCFIFRVTNNKIQIVREFITAITATNLSILNNQTYLGDWSTGGLGDWGKEGVYNLEIWEPWDLVNGGLVVFEIVGHAQWDI